MADTLCPFDVDDDDEGGSSSAAVAGRVDVSAEEIREAVLQNERVFGLKTDVTKLDNDELRLELQRRDLSDEGSRSQLVDRLWKAVDPKKMKLGNQKGIKMSLHRLLQCRNQL